MSTVYTNVQIQDIRRQTNYPFAIESTCDFKGSTLYTGSILSLVIQVQRAIFPLRITKAIKQQTCIKLHITDISQQLIAVIELRKYKILHPVKNIYNQLIGNLVTTEDSTLYNTFGTYFQNSKEITIDKQSFIISPNCIKCVNFDTVRYIKCEQHTIGGPVAIYFDNNCFLQAQKQGITINVAGDIDKTYIFTPKLKTIRIKQINEEQTIVKQYILNANATSSRNIVIKHQMLSNLRVVTKESQILLLGVTDVS